MIKAGKRDDLRSAAKRQLGETRARIDQLFET
jgi:hypothetical protein